MIANKPEWVVLANKLSSSKQKQLKLNRNLKPSWPKSSYNSSNTKNFAIK